MKGIRKIIIILNIIFVMLCLTSCKQNIDDNTSNKRPIVTIGSEDYPPFMDLDNNGNPTGIDVDILKIAFDRIGYNTKYVTISWEEKDRYLESGEVDCVTGGFTIEGREDEYLWVGPYMKCNQVVVVNSTSGINSFQDLNGKTIGVQAASVGEQILLEHSNANIPSQIQVFSYEDNTLTFASLGSNYVDAIVVDELAAIQYMNDYSTDFVILDEPVMEASVGTAFFKNGDKELCQKVNDAIKQMRDDGTIEGILKLYLEDASKYMVGGKDEK